MKSLYSQVLKYLRPPNLDDWQTRAFLKKSPGLKREMPLQARRTAARCGVTACLLPGMAPPPLWFMHVPVTVRTFKRLGTSVLSEVSG